jgi:hypothetical protein
LLLVVAIVCLPMGVGFASLLYVVRLELLAVGKYSQKLTLKHRITANGKYCPIRTP